MSVLEPNESGGTDQLSFVSAARAGGHHVAGRSYSDFAINGRPLHPIIERDLVSVFGCFSRELEREYARLLWPKEHAPARAVLYVCGECGDLGCGYFSVEVRIADDCVVWSEPGWEDNLGPVGAPDSVRAFEGPWRDLWFDRVEYRTALGYYL